MPRIRSWLTSWILCASCCVSLTTSYGNEPLMVQRSDLEARLHSWYSSVETLSFKCEEWRTTPDGVPLSELGVSHTEFKKASNARLNIKNDYVYPDRTECIVDHRQNGSKRFILFHFKENPSKIDSVEITSQTDTVDHLPDGTTPWVIVMPFGRPLTSYLGEHAKLAQVEPNSPNSHLILSLESTGRLERWELAPEFDYLPVYHRVELRGSGKPSVTEARVTKFGQDHGHFFPISGTRTYPLNDEETHYTEFLVKDLRINRGIPDAEFEMPKVLEKGVMVRDLTKGAKPRVIGSRTKLEQIEVRKDYLSRNMDEQESITPSLDTPIIQVSPEPAPYIQWASTGLIIIACLCWLGWLFRSRTSR